MSTSVLRSLAKTLCRSRSTSVVACNSGSMSNASRRISARLNCGRHLSGDSCGLLRRMAFAAQSRTCVIQSKHLSGEVVQGWFAASITLDKQISIGSWSDQQLSQNRPTGHCRDESAVERHWRFHADPAGRARAVAQEPVVCQQLQWLPIVERVGSSKRVRFVGR